MPKMAQYCYESVIQQLKEERGREYCIVNMLSAVLFAAETRVKSTKCAQGFIPTSL